MNSFNLPSIIAKQKQIELSDFKTVLNAETYKLKDNIHNAKYTEQLVIDELIGKTVNSLILFFRKDNYDVSDELIREFINVFIGFELENEYDIVSKCYRVVVVPFWKPFNQLDMSRVDRLQESMF